MKLSVRSPSERSQQPPRGAIYLIFICKIYARKFFAKRVCAWPRDILRRMNDFFFFHSMMLLLVLKGKKGEGGSVWWICHVVKTISIYEESCDLCGEKLLFRVHFFFYFPEFFHHCRLYLNRWEKGSRMNIPEKYYREYWYSLRVLQRTDPLFSERWPVLKVNFGSFCKYYPFS